MEREVRVYIDLDGMAVPVGTLWSRENRGKESASFKYEESWLERSDRFALQPALSLDEGTHHSDKALFGQGGSVP